MTICIAAIAADRSAIVVASDKMLSAAFLNLEFDHPRSKLEHLGSLCIGMSAGDALPVGELFASANPIATQLQNPQVEQIAGAIKEKYCKVRAKRIQETVFQPRGLTIDAFYQEGLIRQFPPDIAVSLDDMVHRGNLGIDLIIAGVDQYGAHIFGVSDPGIVSPYDRIGYHAIGSGLNHALLCLIGTGQNWLTSINQTVFNVYRAKRQAELAPGVGQSIDMRVITSEVSRSVTDEEYLHLKTILEELLVPQDKQLHEKISKLGFNEREKDE